MAYENNKVLYNELFLKLYVFQTFTTGYLSDIFKKEFGSCFLFCNNKLYHFNNIYWKNDDNRTILHNFIDKEFYNFVNAEKDKFTIQYEGQMDELKFKTGITNISALLIQLRTITYRENLIKDVIHKITNNDIIFNTNPYLFVFDNAIYCLKEYKFITPEPKDYISMSTGYNYNFDIIDKLDKMNKLEQIFNIAFPDETVKEFNLQILSSCLDGIPLEKCIIHNGKGRNSKGLINDLLYTTLGNYGYILPANVIQCSMQKAGSNPEIANMRDMRLVLVREPNKDVPFNISVVKEITGGDRISARLNYSNEMEVKLALTFIIECNEKPKINSIDNATIQRIEDVPYESCGYFKQEDIDELDEPDKINAFIINTFYKTYQFKQEYKQILFDILCNYHQKFMKNNRTLPACQKIKQRNIKYFQDSDEILNFITEYYEYTDDRNFKNKNYRHITKLKDVYEKYKISDLFLNMNKLQKRQNNYKQFVEKLKTNNFIKKYVDTTKDRIYILLNYKLIIDDENNKYNCLD
jgi:phage/plasmid-associated DNA primase